ncbi:MAG: ABC transporter permease [Bacteroidales bacterium]|nr:ABC transporter permease [Bacteroidales bacterium]
MARIYKKGKTTLVSSILNILGLTAAFAALYIILVQVHHDLTYNKGLKDSDRIYVLTMPDRFSNNVYSTYVNRQMSEAVIAAVPSVEAGGCAANLGSNEVSVRLGEGQSSVELRVTSFSKPAIDVFGFELVAGNLDNWISYTDAVMSESAAKRLGLQVGDHFQFGSWNWTDATVAAIYKDMPVNSDLSSIDFILNLGDAGMSDWSQWGWNYFIKLAEGADPKEFDEIAHQVAFDLFKTTFDIDESNLTEEKTADLEEYKKMMSPHLMKLTDNYFADNVGHPGKSGNRTTTITLLVIAIFVMLIAFINYINFFFAMVPLRLRSINTRKILGSSRFQLVMSLVGESVLMVVIALGLAVAVVTLFRQSTLAALIDTPLNFGQNLGIAALTVGIALLISVLASLYPALFSTSFNPAFALKGTLGTTQKGKAFRIGLIGLQFTVSIVLIICAIFVHQQRDFMMNHDMGFNQENLLQSHVTWELANNRETVENQLKTDADIKDIAWGDGPFVANSRMAWSRPFKGDVENVSWQVYPVSWNFLRFMGIDIVEGRDFTPADEQSENGVYIINETAQKKYGITTEDRIKGHKDAPAEIAGICKDFNFSALRDEISPFAFYVYGKEPWSPCMRLFIRTEAGVDTQALMERSIKTLNDLDPTLGDGFSVWMRPFEQAIENQYKKEQNLSKLVTLFTILAIVISLMGVFGLVMFDTEHRRKEIGIRRVHGATVGQILAMFNSRFVKVVLVCFVVAVPVSIVIMRRYLEGFAYQVPLHVWVFALALLAVLAVTIAVVTLRSLRAATVNPVKSLRNE